MTEAAVSSAPRTFMTGLKRGIARRCPNCAKGHLFTSYLKVQGTCEVCGNENGRYPSDDGPAYVTILLIGHLVVAPLLALSFLWSLPPAIIAAVGLPVVGAATLAALPFVKGGWIGVLWGTNASAGDEHLG
jgi:uncharacterized protein (DUF983 family)